MGTLTLFGLVLTLFALMRWPDRTLGITLVLIVLYFVIEYVRLPVAHTML